MSMKKITSKTQKRGHQQTSLNDPKLLHRHQNANEKARASQKGIALIFRA